MPTDNYPAGVVHTCDITLQVIARYHNYYTWAALYTEANAVAEKTIKTG